MHQTSELQECGSLLLIGVIDLFMWGCGNAEILPGAENSPLNACIHLKFPPECMHTCVDSFTC